MERIPLVDLSRQYANMKEEILPAIDEVLQTGEFVLSEYVRIFERRFANYCGVDEAVAVGSGTNALFLALKALGVSSGHEVIVPALTFVATANVVEYCGATPVFVDIEDDTLNIDPNKIKEVLTSKTKAIIPVHFHGHPSNMDPIVEIAKQNALFIIEDCAQALGSEYKGRKVGGLGDLGCFSFYPSKHLGAYGDGGIITTNDVFLADEIRSLRNYGQTRKYIFDKIGYNSRLDEIQAAVLLKKMEYLDEWINKRRELAKKYDDWFSELTEIKTPIEKDYARHVYWVYTLRYIERDDLMKVLDENGISTHIFYPVPIPFQKPYSYLGHVNGDFPISEKCSAEMISIPFFPELKSAEQRYIADVIYNAL